MSARDEYDPNSDAGYTTAGIAHKNQTIDRPLAFVGESIYEVLGASEAATKHNMAMSE